MTRITRFVEAFWEPDITSTRGFDRLVKRNKDGRKLCKELEDYCKERAKAEQAYCKALQNIAKKLEDRDETGDLVKSMRQLKIETEKIGHVHEEAGNNFSKLQQEVNKFIEEYKQSQKQQEDRLSKAQNDKITKYKQTIQLKEKYIQRCKEFENADDVYKQNQHAVMKELVKMEKNREKCLDQKNQATNVYKSSVENLDMARKIWEREMEKACQHFQTLDEERISFLRETLWKSTNVDSKACVDHDEGAEHIRLVLQRCDIAQDIEVFIEHNRLDGRKPGIIKFEDFDRKTTGDNNGNTVLGRPLPKPALGPKSSLDSNSTSQRPAQPLPPQPLPQARSPPPVPEVPLMFFDDASENPYHFASASTGDYSYASVDDLKEGSKPSSTSFPPGKHVVVTKSYNAKQPQEVSLTAGEKVEIVKELTKGMIKVKLKTGRQVIIPIHCITPGVATYL